jgi:hypothetical protein
MGGPGLRALFAVVNIKIKPIRMKIIVIAFRLALLRLNIYIFTIFFVKCVKVIIIFSI